ncbi:hypothetical protein CORC01_04863 [Colletotrichum orchidophilum]|uniref:Uncharacterized protein n=1 Tax=Colletotrichum orchidophilum TaxID=1209926 RepID=A0A1G4BF79_9PEZI|nr:uncharacterized protein CORC01_04863 [Colletotrichum orchidophilum]OHE99962.1 hypothetical protein CORC01_04863 [Colletotrichum orchidophilum]
MVKLSLLALIIPVMADKTQWVSLYASVVGTSESTSFDQFYDWAVRTCQKDLGGFPQSSSDIYRALQLNCENVPQSWCDSYPGGKTYHPDSALFTNPKAEACYTL